MRHYYSLCLVALVSMMVLVALASPSMLADSKQPAPFFNVSLRVVMLLSEQPSGRQAQKQNRRQHPRVHDLPQQ